MPATDGHGASPGLRWHSSLPSANTIISTHPRRVQRKSAGASSQGVTNRGPSGTMANVMHVERTLRNVGNVANLSTPLGLVAALLGGARLRTVDGLIVADRTRLPFLRASAITIGSVVLVPRRSLDEAQTRIPGLLEHEDHHAYQWAYCLGLPFIPAYMAATGWSWICTGDRATANLFEHQAGLELGGYVVGTRRSPAMGIRALGALLSGAVARRSGRPGAASAAGEDA